MDWALQLHGASEIPTNPKQLPCKCIMSSLLILSCNKSLFSTCYFSGTFTMGWEFQTEKWFLVAEKRVVCLGWGEWFSMRMGEISWNWYYTFNLQIAFTFTISSDSYKKRLEHIYLILSFDRWEIYIIVKFTDLAQDKSLALNSSFLRPRLGVFKWHHSLWKWLTHPLHSTENRAAIARPTTGTGNWASLLSDYNTAPKITISYARWYLLWFPKINHVWWNGPLNAIPVHCGSPQWSFSKVGLWRQHWFSLEATPLCLEEAWLDRQVSDPSWSSYVVIGAVPVLRMVVPTHLKAPFDFQVCTHWTGQLSIQTDKHPEIQDVEWRRPLRRLQHSALGTVLGRGRAFMHSWRLTAWRGGSEKEGLLIFPGISCLRSATRHLHIHF